MNKARIILYNFTTEFLTVVLRDPFNNKIILSK